jgi:hypothetical protein
MAMLMVLSPVETVHAETQLPATDVAAPKPKPRTAVVNRVTSHAPASNDTGLPDRPDPNSKVRARDWNAPGVLNLEYMSDA